MDTQDRMVTIAELRHHSGGRSTRKWIAYNGIVYDVTDCPRWGKELHEGLHFPGQDLSTELIDAPHSENVFTRPCVRIIGRLEQ
jgi:predicted heme/steroid binding protein